MKTKITILLIISLVLIPNIGFAGDYLALEEDSFYAMTDFIKEHDDKLYGSVKKFLELLDYDYFECTESGVILAYTPEHNYVFLSEFKHYFEGDTKLFFETEALDINGLVYAPLDELLKILKIEYSISEEYQSIIMDKAIVEKLPKLNVTKEEFRNLSKLLFYEARDGSIIKKIAVGNVVTNRIKSERFQNTINEVIFARGQFPPAHYPSFAGLKPPADCLKAAARALNGENVADECLFFNMVPFPNKEADFYKNIEGDYFYY